MTGVDEEIAGWVRPINGLPLGVIGRRPALCRTALRVVRQGRRQIATSTRPRTSLSS